MQYLRDGGRPLPTLLADVVGLRLEQMMIDELRGSRCECSYHWQYTLDRGGGAMFFRRRQHERKSKKS